MRISTTYDNTVVDGKKVGKVFMVRGDEAYARTTDVLFDIITDSTSANAFEGYKVGFKYNVLRDVGSSGVSLYDGDMLLAKYDWNEDNGETFIGVDNTHTHINPNTCIYLSYDVDHNLYMKYHGNNQCLKSKSKPILVNEPLPQEFKSELEFRDITVSQGVISFSLKLTVNGQTTSAVNNKTIEIYIDDDDTYTEITTNSSGIATYTLPKLEDGLHQITASLQGTSEINPVIETEMINVGYKVEILSYPDPFVFGEHNQVIVSVKDMSGTPVVGDTVTFMSNEETTDANGLATFDIIAFQDGEYSAVYGDYSSEPIIINGYVPQLSLTADKNIITESTNAQLTASLSEPIAGIQIQLDKKYRDSSQVIDSTILTTQQDGKINYVINGDCTGEYDYTATIVGSDISQTIQINDTISYYSPKSPYNTPVYYYSNLRATDMMLVSEPNGLVLKNTGVENPSLRFEIPMEVYFHNSQFKITFQIAMNDCDYMDIPINTRSSVKENARINTKDGVRTYEILTDYDTSTIKIYENNTLIYSYSKFSLVTSWNIIFHTSNKEKIAKISNLEHIVKR